MYADSENAPSEIDRTERDTDIVPSLNSFGQQKPRSFINPSEDVVKNSMPAAQEAEPISVGSPLAKLRKQKSYHVTEDAAIEEDKPVTHVSRPSSATHTSQAKKSEEVPEEIPEAIQAEVKKSKHRKRGKSEVHAPVGEHKKKGQQQPNYANFNGMNLMIDPEQYMAMQAEFMAQQMNSGMPWNGFNYFAPPPTHVDKDNELEYAQFKASSATQSSPKAKHRKHKEKEMFENYQNQMRYVNPFQMPPMSNFQPMAFPNYHQQQGASKPASYYEPVEAQPPIDSPPMKSNRKSKYKHEKERIEKPEKIEKAEKLEKREEDQETSRSLPKEDSIKQDEPSQSQPTEASPRGSIHHKVTPEASISLNPPQQSSPPVIPIAAPLPAIIPAPAPTSVGEKDRVAAIHSLGILDSGDQPRLNKITQMTLRLLGGTCCVLSIVDVDRVIWKSAAWSSSNAPAIKDEPRYESFCSWVIQDDTGRGVTILDSKTDPRCTHFRVIYLDLAKEWFRILRWCPLGDHGQEKDWYPEH